MEAALTAFDQQTQATQASQTALQQAIDDLRSRLKDLQNLGPPAELEHQSAVVPKLEQRARRASEKLAIMQERLAYVRQVVERQLAKPPDEQQAQH